MNLEEKIKILWSKFDSKIIELKHIEKLYNSHNKIFGKVENHNLTGSIKDKTVLNIVDNYFKNGLINKDTKFIEPTSGNTGISLAYIAKELGLKATIVMPSSMSKARREMILKYGAELILVDGAMKDCVDKCVDLMKRDNSLLTLNQFNNEYNSEIHFKLTSQEIDKDLKDVSIIVAGIGTGGTLTGIGKYFKGKAQIIGVEPYESPLLTSNVSGKHKIEGIGANFVPNTLELKYVDKVQLVKSNDAIKMAKMIYELEGVSVGYSSGASLCALLDVIKDKKGEVLIQLFFLQYILKLHPLNLCL